MRFFMVKENLKDLTTGSLWKQILFFGLPLIASNILQVLFNMSDIAVVGRFSSKEALGAVGSTATLVTLFVGILIGIGNGVNVVVARHIGAKQQKETKIAVQTGFLISLTIGILLWAVCFFGARTFLLWLKTKEILLDGAEKYLKIYAFGLPALALYNFGNAVYSAEGNTRKPLLYLLISGMINVFLNLFFVLCLGMDVDGVALASTLSMYFSGGMILLSLTREAGPHRLSLDGFRLNKRKTFAILSLGLPAAFQNSIFAIANLFIQSAVNSFDPIVVEGNSAAMNADGLIYDVMAAFYVACSSFIGQNFGAGKKRRIRDSYFISLLYSFVAGGILGSMLLLFGRSFLFLFTNDAEVVQYGMIRLTVMAFSYAFSAFMDCTIAASRGLGKSFIPTVIVILGSCVFRVVWIYTVFAHFHTMLSLYLLYIFSWTLTSVAEILYFVFCYRHTVMPSSPKIRLARQEELSQILQLYSVADPDGCSWREEFPTEPEIRESFDAGTLYVLVKDGKILGAASIEPKNKLDGYEEWQCCDGTQKELAYVVIVPEAQEQELSEYLISALLQQLSGQDCHVVHLLVAKTNIPAQKTYQKLGFSFCGEEHRDGIDFLLGEKLLEKEKSIV